MKIRKFVIIIILSIMILSFGSSKVIAQTTTRVSVDSNGEEANNDSYLPSITPNGQYIVFESAATNIVAADTNNAEDIFVLDRNTNTIERVSVDAGGVEGNGDSTTSRQAISSDGQYVTFTSGASNLVVGDTNNVEDIFVYNRHTNTTERVSVASNGTQGNDRSLRSSISSDGRYIAFYSFATNLVANDTNNEQDVFVHDRDTGTTERVSVDSSGVEANGLSQLAVISSDGQYVTFVSYATNLVANDTNGAIDIFVHDRQTSTTERVSVNSNGDEANENSMTPFISSDGRYVAYHSWATNLVANDTNGVVDVFVRDRQTSTTERVSVDSNGVQGDDNSYSPILSSNGLYVAFHSKATNLVANDTNNAQDVFVHDRDTGATKRVSVDSNGVQGDDNSYLPSISSNGEYIVFDSMATNLVTNDTNNASDIFLHEDSSGNGDFSQRVDDGSGGCFFNSLIIK